MVSGLSVAFVAWLGSSSTVLGLSWYDELVRPRIAPPSFVFGPVWSVLYLLIAIALWLFILNRPKTIQFQDTLWVFVINGALNAWWSHLFFVRHALLAATIDAGAIALTAWMLVVLVKPFSRLGGWLLVPYACWTTFATVLAYSYWLLN